jgi:hypothetical protein
VSFQSISGGTGKLDYENAFRTLFSICHDLRIVRVWSGTFEIECPVIGDRSTSLRFIEMTWNPNGGKPGFSQTLMEKLPLADALEVLYLDIEGEIHDHFPDSQLYLPQLHSLHLQMIHRGEGSDQILQIRASWSIPSCRFLSLNYQHYMSTLAFDAFLRTLGLKLETFELIWPEALLMPAIIGHCSSIQKLCIPSVYSAPPYTPLPPTPLLRLVQFTGYIDTRGFIESAEEIYAKGRASLQVIQLRDVSGTSLLAELDDGGRDRWTDWSERLLAGNVRLEDKYGDLLGRATDRSREVDSDDEREVFLETKARRTHSEGN